MALKYQEAGRVYSLGVYPFKGMQGQHATELSLRSVSVVGDRVRAFAIEGVEKTPNLLMSEDYPEVLRYEANFKSFYDPKSEVVVYTPDRGEFLADDPDLGKEASERFGKRLSVVRLGRGLYHSMPVSLLSEASARKILTKAEVPTDFRRFRENIVFSTVEDIPYEEDGWIGKRIRFGDRPDSGKIDIVKKDVRCSTVNMDPETGKQGKGEVMRAIIEEKGPDKLLGVYANVAPGGEGTIRIDDVIYIADLD